MEKKKKVIELEILDELPNSGVYEIALVDSPAIESGWMAFKSEEFVNPRSGERQTEFIPRCMSVLVGDEGYPEDQAAAICYSTWRETHRQEFAKVSFDWNETLSTDRAQEIARKHVEDGDTVYIVSAQPEVNDRMREVAKEIGIDLNKIHAVGSNKAKIEFIKKEGIEKHYDNSAEVIDGLGEIGIKFSLFEMAEYPWDECIRDQKDRGLSEDAASRLCGWIKANMYLQFQESYDDYPEAAKNNAQRALDWAEKNGWGDCGTAIGKARANQLAKGEPISEETIARMASFARHEQNSSTPYGEGCGGLMWDAWGGDAGIEWAQNKLESIRTQFSYDVSGLPPYVDEITEDKNKKKTMKFEEMDIFGYKTRYFYICPGAVATFRHLMEMNPDLDTQGMIRSAALIADRVFEIEKNVIDADTATEDDLIQATLLVDDFMDLMHEIDEEVGMIHDVGYMIGHLQVIGSYLPGIKEEFAERPIARIPEEERGRTGSDKNKPGDTKTTRGGIEVPADVEDTLKKKVAEHNEKNPQDSQKADLGMLKAVWRRGAGAYSVGTPGRRGMTRPQWAMGRVNAFLKILSGSQPSDKDYSQDNDLLPKSHPKHSEEKMAAVRDLRVGDPVSWSVGGSNPRGRIRRIVRNGSETVPGTSFVLRGTPDDPGYVIEIYENIGGVWRPTGRYAGRKAGSIMKNVFLSKGAKRGRMLFADEDQQIVVGAAMIPDIEIFRRDKETKEPYYVSFSAETIARIAEKFMRENRNNESNINHDTDKRAGAYVMESWIVETPEDKANTVYNLDVPVGTWVIKMRVQDPKVWKMVKAGELTGFSIEGDFLTKEEYNQYRKDRETYERIVKVLKS